MIVASALGGITDLLLEGAAAATSGRSAAGARAAAVFLRRHRDVARALIPAGPARRRLMATIDGAAREYRELCIAIGVLGHLAPRASDLLVSRGERMSAAIVAAALTTGAAGGQSTSTPRRSSPPTDIMAAPHPTSPPPPAWRAAGCARC